MTARAERIAYVADPALSFWPTPPEVADDLVYQALIPGWGSGEAAGGVPQVRILEPSAGEGHLARAARERLPYAHITAVEPGRQRAAALRALPGVIDEVVESTIEDYITAAAFSALGGSWQPFDLVCMNPPFTLDDRPEAWAEHVLALHDDPYILAPGGVISALVPRIVLTGRSKLVRAVRALLGTVRGRYADGTLLCEAGEARPCERDAFGAVGAQVSTAMILIEKAEAGGESRG